MKIKKMVNGYRADFRCPITGRRLRPYFRATTMAEAKLMAEHYRSELLSKGGIVPVLRSKAPLICEAAELYLTTCSQAKLPSSQTIDRLSLIGFCKVVGNVSTNQLNDIDVDRYISEEKKRAMMVSSINRRLNSIRHFLKWCHKQNWLSSDVSTSIRHIKGPCRESRPLNNLEISMMFSHAGVNMRLQIQLAATLGLRAGEVASLEWEQIDFERSRVRIGGTKSFRTKSGRPKTLYLSPELSDALQKHSKVSRWLFPNINGDGPIDRMVITRNWARVRKRANLRDIKFHDLRATAATRLADYGLGDAGIANILGHSSIQMARKYSNRVQDQVLADGIMGIEKTYASVFGHLLVTFEKSEVSTSLESNLSD